jgi:hypothetical protein
MKKKKQEKQRLENLNILVYNDAESKFVLDIAWKHGYEWRKNKSNSKVYRKPNASIYRREKGKDGSFIYCFDYENELEEFKLSFFSLLDNDDCKNAEALIKEFELKVYHASELMKMSSAALDLFLRLR